MGTIARTREYHRPVLDETYRSASFIDGGGSFEKSGLRSMHPAAARRGSRQRPIPSGYTTRLASPVTPWSTLLRRPRIYFDCQTSPIVRRPIAASSCRRLLCSRSSACRPCPIAAAEPRVYVQEDRTESFNNPSPGIHNECNSIPEGIDYGSCEPEH